MTIAPNDFTHLHVHSEFSLLDGLGRITDIVEAAAQQGMDSLALTDHGALYGAVAFYQAAKDQGHQADHRHRDVRRPPVDDRQGGQGRQPALPPDPPGPGLAGLPEPLPPRDRRPPRRLLLQAAHRPRPPREAQRRAHRAVGVPQRRGRQGARGGRLGARPDRRGPVRRHLRQGPLLPRAPGPRPARAAAAQRAAHPARPGGRAAAGRHQRPPLRPPGPVRGARRPALRGHRQQPRHAQPHEVRQRRVLREVGGPDGRALPGPPRRDPEQPAHRRDDRHRAAARAAPHPALPGARRPHRRELAAGRVPARPRAPLRDRDPRPAGAPRLRARRDPHDGLRRLLPDRGGLHPVRARAGDPDHLPGQRPGQHRDLHARHHAGGPDPLPAARSSGSSTRTA